MSVIDMRECHCECHKREGVHHIMPCCYSCSGCGRHIKLFWAEKHKEECKSKASILPDWLAKVLLKEVK